MGLVKLIEGGSLHANTKFPQLDMISLSHPPPSSPHSTFWQQEIYSALRELKTLSIVDGSSNEHQVLRDIFSDLSAVSTAKLLQLAHTHQQKQGVLGEGFLALNAEMVKKIEETPALSHSLYFSHFERSQSVCSKNDIAME